MNRFVAECYGEGYAVIDSETGHPMTGERATRQSAAATANILNNAANAGAQALARALGATDDDLDDVFVGVKF